MWPEITNNTSGGSSLHARLRPDRQRASRRFGHCYSARLVATSSASKRPVWRLLGLTVPVLQCHSYIFDTTAWQECDGALRWFWQKWRLVDSVLVDTGSRTASLHVQSGMGGVMMVAWICRIAKSLRFEIEMLAGSMGTCSTHPTENTDLKVNAICATTAFVLPSVWDFSYSALIALIACDAGAFVVKLVQPGRAPPRRCVSTTAAISAAMSFTFKRPLRRVPYTTVGRARPPSIAVCSWCWKVVGGGRSLPLYGSSAGILDRPTAAPIAHETFQWQFSPPAAFTTAQREQPSSTWSTCCASGYPSLPNFWHWSESASVSTAVSARRMIRLSDLRRDIRAFTAVLG